MLQSLFRDYFVMGELPEGGESFFFDKTTLFVFLTAFPVVDSFENIGVDGFNLL